MDTQRLSEQDGQWEYFPRQIGDLAAGRTGTLMAADRVAVLSSTLVLQSWRLGGRQEKRRQARRTHGVGPRGCARTRGDPEPHSPSQQF